MNELDKRVFWRFTKRNLLFGGVGVITTVGGELIIFGLTIIGWSPDISNLIQAFLSIVSSFYLNNKYTWADRGNVPLQIKQRMFVLTKFITVPLNALIFRVVIALAGLLLQFFIGVFHPIVSAELVRQLQFLAGYGVSTIVIIFVNLPLYNRGVYAFEGVQWLRKKLPWLAQWVESAHPFEYFRIPIEWLKRRIR